MAEFNAVDGFPCGCAIGDPPIPLWGTTGMDEYSSPSFGGMFGGGMVSQLDSVNGAYMGPLSGSTAPANPEPVSAAQQGGGINPLSAVPFVGDANATLVWWFILLGLLVGAHVLTLKLQH